MRKKRRKQRLMRRVKLMKIYGDTCPYCKRKMQPDNDQLPNYATMDHVIPRSKGGSRRGVELVCQECNNFKADMVPLYVRPRIKAPAYMFYGIRKHYNLNAQAV